MDDLTRIEADIKTKRGAQEQADVERKEKFRAEQAASRERLVKMAARLQVFKQSVSVRVPVFMRFQEDQAAIKFCIGSSRPWLAGPAYSFVITSGSGDQSFSIRSAGAGEVCRERLSSDGVIEALSEFVAAEIERPHPYRWPDWITRCYEFGGQVVAVIAFIGAWIVIGATGGLWGIVLGWIPAGLLACVLAASWPVAALLLVSLFFW